MTTSCIVVEDEPLARERLAGYVRALPYLSLLAEFDEALEALAFLKTQRVDLVFLDIGLGGLSGIQLLETTAVTSQVILTTAHPEFALKAYDLKVVDYLLKPFSFARFVQAVERVHPARPGAEGGHDRRFLFVKTELRLEKVLLAEVLYIEGQGDYRLIHTAARRILTLETFGELEARIPPDLVCRVHKSYMVALDKIESIERDRIKIREQRIPISDTYRERFYRRIGRAG
jgi:two-component system LytT family response regulator